MNGGSGQWKRLRCRIGHALDDDDDDECVSQSYPLPTLSSAAASEMPGTLSGDGALNSTHSLQAECIRSIADTDLAGRAEFGS